MPDPPSATAVATTMQRINQAWLEGRFEDLASCLHPRMAMSLPGFSATIEGREEIIEGFRDFCSQGTVIDFRESDRLVHATDHTAVISFRYEMIYERSGGRYRATGRDLWLFERREAEWLAVWRTMLETSEEAA